MGNKEGRNIVICCDGTGNQYKPNNNSNVLKLYSALERSERQLLYYDPGVGTQGTYNALTKVARTYKWVLGMAFGLGTTQDISQAYAFLTDNYRDGDRIYLFGFSRGAFTARAVAGLIKKCGLIHPDNGNLIPETIRIYKDNSNNEWSDDYREIVGRHPVPIHFLGVWDTVTSLGWIYEPVRLAYTTKNPIVQHVRHAIAIDERRAFFRSNRFYPTKGTGQDIKQVWFPGVHSDVGGGYDLEESSLSNIALEWMAVEAHQYGLLIDREKILKLVQDPAVPTARADAHNSLKAAWMPAEIFPKIKHHKTKNGKWIKYPALNLAKRRSIKPDETLHESVIERIKARTDYPPPNLKKLCKPGAGKDESGLFPPNPIEPRVSIEEGIPESGDPKPKAPKKKAASKKKAAE